MREERQMLGQMISQVHHQQQELKELQNQITSNDSEAIACCSSNFLV
jgi:hypothetical protein